MGASAHAHIPLSFLYSSSPHTQFPPTYTCIHACPHPSILPAHTDTFIHTRTHYLLWRGLAEDDGGQHVREGQRADVDLPSWWCGCWVVVSCERRKGGKEERYNT